MALAERVVFDPHADFTTAPAELRLIVSPGEDMDPVFGVAREEIRRMLDEDEAQDRALLEAVFGASIASVRDDASED